VTDSEEPNALACVPIRIYIHSLVVTARVMPPNQFLCYFLFFSKDKLAEIHPVAKLTTIDAQFSRNDRLRKGNVN
jgi:hypothetical protein